MRKSLLLIFILLSFASTLRADPLLPVGTPFVGDVGGDAGFGSIYVLNPDGSRRVLIPTPNPGTGTFVPTSLAFDSSGNLFFANFHTGRIFKLTDGGLNLFAAGPRFQLDIAFDSSGNLFVSSYFTGEIFKYAPDGSRTIFASGLSGPAGLAFDGSGKLFVTEEMIGNIMQFSSDGSRVPFASGLHNPLDLAFDSSGQLFETDQGTGTIFKFAPDGSRITFASGLSDLAGFAFDNTGHLLVADLVGNVYAFAPDGSRSTFATGLTAPFSIAFNPVPFNAGPFNPDLVSGTSVPEPTTLVLLSAGLAGVAIKTRKKLKSRKRAISD